MVHFWPDDSIFITLTYNKDILEGRLRELSYLNRGVGSRLKIFGKKKKTALLIPKYFIVKAVSSNLWKCWIAMPAACTYS